MNDCSPLRMAEQGQSSGSSRSSGSFQLNENGQRRNRNQRRPARSTTRETGNRNDAQRDDDDNNRRRRDDDNASQGPLQGGSSSAAHHHQEQDQQHLSRSASESLSSSGHLRYGAKNVIELFIPVSLCMLIVVGTMKATDSYRYSSQTVILYAQVMFTDQSVDTVLIFLYIFRYYAIIHGWLILSSLVLLFVFTGIYIAELLKVYNIPMDHYTILIFLWNFGVVGMVCIHWKGPLLLQQGYLIIISALMVLNFIRSLPDWTIWTVLAIVSVWDLVAVLCPRGPLRILVETAQARNEAIFPALIYSSTMLWEVITLIPSTISMAKTTSSSANTTNRRGPSRPTGSSSSSRSQHPVEIQYDEGAQPPQVDIIQPTLSSSSDNWATPVVRSVPPRGLASGATAADTSSVERDDNLQQDQNQDPTDSTINMNNPQDRQAMNESQLEEERGVKLGLGDFIFFSLLVGKASSFGDWTITMSCYVAILVGLCLTLSLLAVFRKALPALPISIAFGLGSFFMSYMFAVPLAERLALEQVFI